MKFQRKPKEKKEKQKEKPNTIEEKLEEDSFESFEEAYNSSYVSPDFDLERWREVIKQKEIRFGDSYRGKTSQAEGLTVEEQLGKMDEYQRNKKYKKGGFGKYGYSKN